MTRTDLRALPDYWTPKQALAVYALLDGLREIILSRYEAQIIDAFRDQCASSAPPDPQRFPVG